ncbi:MAG: DUF3014 domain-containing protein [Acidobacteria bacterium]|nr:DUF3014 domain-containing protein [Acidobacteriota bacterium]MCB9397907.1 DUF3014 domain-containing protein [Acidobacteriota bacterium]
MKPLPIAIGAAVVIAGILFFMTREKPVEIEQLEADQVQIDKIGPPVDPNPPAEDVETRAAQPVNTPEPELTRPDLEESDPFLETEHKNVSSHPYWNRLWEQNHLIRKFATAADLISRNKNPYSQAFFLRPSGEFTVQKNRDQAYLSEKNFQRYQGLVTAVEAIDTAKAVQYYHFLEPVFEAAYKELGNTDRSWQETLNFAMTQIETTPLPSAPPELIGQGKVYIFKDPSLEALPPVQKAMIRMGNINARKIIEAVKAFHAQI